MARFGDRVGQVTVRGWRSSDRSGDAPPAYEPVISAAERMGAILMIHPTPMEATVVDSRFGLRDLLGQRVVALVFGCQPDLTGLLQHLLALRMHTRVQCRHGSGPLGAVDRTILELGEQGFESLHGS